MLRPSSLTPDRTSLWNPLGTQRLAKPDSQVTKSWTILGITPWRPPPRFKTTAHFAGIFNLEALARVRRFFPAEMALPNHPDVCYEFIKTLKDGYRWLLVQEHTVEEPEDSHSIRDPPPHHKR